MSCLLEGLLQSAPPGSSSWKVSNIKFCVEILVSTVVICHFSQILGLAKLDTLGVRVPGELLEASKWTTRRATEADRKPTEAALKWLIWHVFGCIPSLKQIHWLFRDVEKRKKKTNSGGPSTHICFAALISMVKNMFIFVMWGPGKVIILIHTWLYDD